jgi:hypothetical protein
MLAFLHATGSDRKLRLFAVACVRRIWNLPQWNIPALNSGVSRAAVESAERNADGLEDETSLQRITKENYLFHPAGCAIQFPAIDAAGRTSVAASREAAVNLERWEETEGEPDEIILVRETRAQVSVLQDIFGNPFRPVVFDPEWRTSTAVALTKQMYDSRDFSTMPILADALQDAGCDNDDILNHCRQPGEHVRGCWVVDLVLGKS